MHPDLKLNKRIIVSDSIYQINKSINKSIEVKGLKAQYVCYFGGGLVLLLILFTAMYICRANVFICLAFVALSGTALFMFIDKLLMKMIAKTALPKVIKLFRPSIEREIIA